MSCTERFCRPIIRSTIRYCPRSTILSWTDSRLHDTNDESADELVFKAIDVNTNTEYSITERVVFSPDVLGSQAAPYTLNFETPSSVDIISPAGYAEFPIFNVKGQIVNDEDAENGILIIDGAKILK